VVSANIQVTLPPTNEQTLLSLISSGQVSMQSPTSLTQQAGLVYPNLAAAPILAPPGQGSPPAVGGGNVDPIAVAKVTLNDAALSAIYGGS
jgi:hypothetical protein